MTAINETIARAINARPQQVQAAIQLLDEGATVPFIARYRKEVTGALDDGQLRQLHQQLGYLRDLAQRKQQILDKLGQDGRLTDPLRRQIQQADTKASLEQIYQPFKSSRRTKAQQAREAGLEPLVRQLLQAPRQPEIQAARAFINAEHGFADEAAVLEGAEAIIIATLAEATGLVDQLRRRLWREGLLVSAAKGKADPNSKFRDYFEHQELLRKAPSHRLLAILRGQREEVLKVALQADGLDPQPEFCRQLGVRPEQIQGRWLEGVLQRAWRRKLHPQLQKELLGQARETAEAGAIEVFARNLKQLLLAAPAGARTTLGLDPGLRTGVKVAVISATGKLLATDTIYPHAPRNQWQQSLAQLAKLCRQHRVELVSIGNGTGSRETDRLVAELIDGQQELKLQKIMVSEAGASVYSASELAAREFPELDVSLRGAVSIARRLQDPLAELVKIEPKAIGVGQYQHDVNQSALSQQLTGVVEDCVNSVGVDLNSASPALLQYVSGLTPALAENIVRRRDDTGPFRRRSQLLEVPRLGPKAYEQAAGFLRIRDGDEALDGSAVHPEAYGLVKRIAASRQRTPADLIGDRALLASLSPADYIDERFGEPTILDILKELEKPGRDPRPEFATARFRDDINSLDDLKPDMRLQGVVTNVTNFGAFVDIGVHQDGLVHISALADRFVKDPHELVKAGDIVNVRVLEVDKARKRIGLSMKSGEAGDANAEMDAGRKVGKQPRAARKPVDRSSRPAADKATGTMGQLLNEALKKNRSPK